MRQHQIAYRPRTLLTTRSQPVGGNEVAIALPRTVSDDSTRATIRAESSFPIAWTKMLHVVSRCVFLLNVLGPAPEYVSEGWYWNEIFSSLKRLDVLFVPKW